MDQSRAIGFFVSFAITAAAAFFSYNEASLLLDPYNVFWRRTEMPKAAWAIEQFRSAKIRHLANNPNLYDTLILADSRGAMARIREVSRDTNTRLFTLSASADAPVGFLPKVRWATGTQTKLQKVVLLLELGQFQAEPRHDLLIFHEHPYVSGESWLSYYWTFSNLPYQTFLTSARYYVKRLLGVQVDAAVLLNSGFDPQTGETNAWGRAYSEFEPTAEDRAQFATLSSSDPPGRLRFHNSVLEPDVVSELARERGGPSAPMRKDQVESFIELIALLRNRGIQSECVVIPVPVAGLWSQSIALRLDWMRFVAEQCGTIWDFSFPSPITSDTYNYWDVSHFLPHVAKMMLTRVLGSDAAGSDFGARISAANFDEYRHRWEVVGRQMIRRWFASLRSPVLTNGPSDHAATR